MAFRRVEVEHLIGLSMCHLHRIAGIRVFTLRLGLSSTSSPLAIRACILRILHVREVAAQTHRSPALDHKHHIALLAYPFSPRPASSNFVTAKSK